MKNNPWLNKEPITSHLVLKTNSKNPPLFFLLIAIFALTGCVTLNDPEVSQEFNADVVGLLDPNTSMGQTFTSRRPLLNGITLWLSTPSNSDSATSLTSSESINIKLFHTIDDPTPIFNTNILPPQGETQSPITISIPNLENTAGESFYLQLSTGGSHVQVHGRNEDSFPDGSAYLNGVVINADIAFRISYDYDSNSLVEDLKAGIQKIWLIFPILLVLWLPGWLLLEFSGLRSRLDLDEEVGLSLGISLATIPVLMLWTTILKIKWTQQGVQAFALLLSAVLVIRIIYVFYIRKKTGIMVPASNPGQRLIPALRRMKLFSTIALILILIFVVTLAIRLIMIRDLATPAWVDSVHHALITRLIMENGRYPASFLPYFDIPQTSYHPGFHSIAAIFTWLSDLPLHQSLLILGQVLNAMAVFSVYLFTKTITGSTTAGLVSAGITGFMMPMPAYYTSWGRYTELAGLLILPAIFSILLIDNNEPRTSRRNLRLIIGGLTAAGLFLVHYRVALFFGGLLVSYFLVQAFMPREKNSQRPLQVLPSILIVALIAIIFAIPWIIPTINNTVRPFITPSELPPVPFFQDFSWGYLTAALGKQALVAAGIGLCWGIFRGKEFSFTLVIWILILFLVANLDALQLPGGGLVSSLSVQIILFMPISALGGFLVSEIIANWKTLIPQRFVILFTAVVGLALGTVAVKGALHLVSIINPVTILTRSADIPAMDWINRNVPQGESFIINPFAWGYGAYAGSDGGYWISSLTGRQTLPPPVLYGLGEDSAEINQLSQDILNLGNEPIGLSQFLIDRQIKYLYLGAKGGMISPERLEASGLYLTIYQAGGVWIFMVKPVKP